jgi:PAS domain S-box-containing protein
LRGQYLLEVLALACVYLMAGKVGLFLATVGANVSPFWPPIGVALAVLALRGPSRWPGVFLGAWAVNASTTASMATSLGIAAGNTLAVGLGALLLRRAGFDRRLERIRDVVALSAGAGALCVLVSSSVGSLCLALGGALAWEELGRAVWVWWVGDLIGVLVVAPPLLCLPRLKLPRRWGEALLLTGLATALGAAIFFVPGVGHSVKHAATFLLFPMSAWAALRFGSGGAAATTLAIAAAAVAGTARGQGPFSSGHRTDDLLVLQLFIAVTSVTGLLLAAASEERRRAVEKLQLLAATVRGVHEGVIIAEVLAPGSLRIVFANEALCGLVGQRLEDLVGKEPYQLYREPGPELRERVEAALRAGESMCMEVSLPRQDGTLVWSEVLVSPVRATGEDVTHLVATHRDITATKELQARLVAAERVAAVGTLAAGVGHEINNPLAYMVLNLEAASRNLSSEGGVPSVRDALTGVRGALEGAERIRLIVRDLQVFSRQVDQERGLVDLNALVPPAVRIVSHALRHRARLVEEFGPVPRVLGSEARLGQVLLNLLVNAMQAIPEGSPTLNEVRVRTSTDVSGRARVDVVDTGAGIPAHVLPRIFEPFFTTKPMGEGTGLGLAICQQIVRAHGGELEVRSEPGHGSVFSMLLPAATVQVGAAPRPVPREPPPAPRTRRGRVLVVDDEPRLAQSMRLLLEPYHDIVTTTRGSEALALVSAGHHFDIILCDLQMPETDGAGVYRGLCALNPVQAERVVFISGGAYTAESRAFIESVANRVLEKPVRPEVLMATVDAALTDRRGLEEAEPVSASAGGSRH